MANGITHRDVDVRSLAHHLRGPTLIEYPADWRFNFREFSTYILEARLPRTMISKTSHDLPSAPD